MTNKKYKMEPKEYGEFLKKVELESIYFKKYSVKSSKENIAPDITLTIKHSASFDLNAENPNRALVRINYKLNGYKQRKSDYAILIDCDIEATLISNEPITEDFLWIYIDINLNHNTWPYFREFVQSATNKSGIPPLTLPFLYTK